MGYPIHPPFELKPSQRYLYAPVNGLHTDAEEILHGESDLPRLAIAPSRPRSGVKRWNIYEIDSDNRVTDRDWWDRELFSKTEAIEATLRIAKRLALNPQLEGRLNQ